MKRLFLILIVFFLMNGWQCDSNLESELQGKWMDVDYTQEVPDILLFYKNGRYIIFNDLESQYYWIPIIEKGNWTVKNRTLSLIKRECMNDDSDHAISFSIKRLSKNELVLVGENQQREQYTKTYRRTEFSAVMMHRYQGYASSIKELALPSPGGAILLKLKYKLLHPGTAENAPAEILVEDQDGHELWRKVLILKHEKQTEEILLADKPEVIKLTHLTFKISTEVGWELLAKVY